MPPYIQYDILSIFDSVYSLSYSEKFGHLSNNYHEIYSFSVAWHSQYPHNQPHFSFVTSKAVNSSTQGMAVFRVGVWFRTTHTEQHLYCTLYSFQQWFITQFRYMFAFPEASLGFCGPGKILFFVKSFLFVFENNFSIRKCGCIQHTAESFCYL